MIQSIINTVITIIVTGCMALISKKIKSIRSLIDSYMTMFVEIKDSQLMDMKSDLSNKFFVYDAMEEVEDYLVSAFREKCERYFKMGGDTWIHPMYDRSFEWKMKYTGYVK